MSVYTLYIILLTYTHIHILFLISTHTYAHTYVILGAPEEKKHFLRVLISAVVKEGKLQPSPCLWFPSCARCITKALLNKAWECDNFE